MLGLAACEIEFEVAFLVQHQGEELIHVHAVVAHVIVALEQSCVPFATESRWSRQSDAEGEGLNRVAMG